MLRLTRDEILLIAGLMVALVAGTIVKHHRDQKRTAALLSPASESIPRR